MRWNSWAASCRTRPSRWSFRIFWSAATRRRFHRGDVSPRHKARTCPRSPKSAIAQPVQTALRMANRRHDVVAVQITDRYELELPALGPFDSGGRRDRRNCGTQHRPRQQPRRVRLAPAKTERGFGAGSSGRPALTPFNCERTSLTRRRLGKFFETREKRRLRG